MIMERQFVRCHKCDDTLEVEYRRGKWFCENCGTDLTKETERKMKAEAEFERKYNRKHRK